MLERTQSRYVPDAVPLDLSAWECCLLSLLLRSCHRDAQGLQMQSVVSLRCHVCGERLSSPPYRPA